MTKTIFVEAIKGGTGKTIVATNLAHMLSQNGETALIDADLDSPNFPDLVDIDKRIETLEAGEAFKPIKWEGIKVFSMGLLADRDKSISMSGERYGKIINDVATRSEWGNPDFVVCDMPAGASNVYQRLTEVFADYLCGSIAVITPDTVSDSRRILRLHEMNGIPLLGVIENMAFFECDCGKKWNIFGESAIDSLQENYDFEMLGRIPMVPNLKKNPIIEEGSGFETIERTVKKVVELEEEKVGVLGKIREKMRDITTKQVRNIVITMLKITNKDIDLSKYQDKYGYKKARPLNFVITDATSRKELFRTRFVLKDGKLMVNKRDNAVAEIVMDVTTLSRVVVGKKKVNDEEIEYDAWDAWLNGDIEVYGDGSTSLTAEALRNLFEDETLLREMRESYGKILNKLI